jgi:hypothetical protein
MCFGFGESKPTETKTSTGNTATTNAANTANNSSTSLPAWLTNASQGNLSFLNNLRDAGYQEYAAPRVADLSNDENSAYGMIRALAGSTNPYSPEIASLFRKVGSTAPDTLSTTRAIDNVPGQGASGSTQDYMNPFVDAVLAPQLRELDRNQTLSQNNLDASRTMGGAFGDARSGFEAAENTRNFTNARIDTTGKANADAFDRAMALKTNDISRLLDVSKGNAALKEQGLARALAGGNALMGLDRYDTGRQADLAGMLERASASQRGVEQSKLDAAYQEFSKKTGFPLELSKLILQAISGSPAAAERSTSTTGSTNSTGTGTSNNTAVTQKPDNSGWGMLGSLAGTALGSFLGPAGASVGGALGGSLFGDGSGGYFNGSSGDQWAAAGGGYGPWAPV